MAKPFEAPLLQARPAHVAESWPWPDYKCSKTFESDVHVKSARLPLIKSKKKLLIHVIAFDIDWS